jgi:hypothetical protein
MPLEQSGERLPSAVVKMAKTLYGFAPDVLFPCCAGKLTIDRTGAVLPPYSERANSPLSSAVAGRCASLPADTNLGNQSKMMREDFIFKVKAIIWR